MLPAMKNAPVSASLSLVVAQYLAFFAVVALSAVACGGNTASNLPNNGPTKVCHDQLTGKCIPCPGQSVCVDPKTCKVVPCGDGGSLFTDTATSDTSSSSDAAGSDITSDSGSSPVDAGKPATCKLAEKSCADDKTPQFCAQGTWLKLNPCKDGYKCDGGACVCAKECLAVGQRQCIGTIDAFKTCQLDPENKDAKCLVWGIPAACAPGKLCKEGDCIDAPKKCEPPCPKGHTCSKGKCLPPDGCKPPCSTGQVCNQGTCVGTLGCGQILACVNQFSQGPGDTVNINACVAKGTAAAQALYKKRRACIDLSCKKLIDAKKANEAMLCVYTSCATEQTTCIGSGALTCDKFTNCLAGCGTSIVCTLGCHSSAAVEAIKAYYSLTNCGDQYCKGMSGQAYGTCTAQKCKGTFDNCFGTGGSSGGGGGTYSCNQILQCVAQNCKTTACADQCKAKGSAKGQADLKAFIDCKNQYCKNYCDAGSAAQCNACIKAACAKQNAVCGYTN